MGENRSLNVSDNLNLTNTLNELSPLEKLNIKTFGAIGNGNSNPLSSKYTTLEQAKIDYPFATSLNDELDWASCQKAVNFAISKRLVSSFSNSNMVSSVYKIYLPIGIYTFNRPISSLGNTHLIFEGESAIIHSKDSLGTAFDLSAAWAMFTGIKMVNFNIGIRFYNSNIDGGYLRLYQCEFHEMRTQGIYFSAQSSDLTINECRFISFNSRNSNFVKSVSGTTLSLNGCWIEGNPHTFFDARCERLVLNNCSGIPTGESTWVKLRNGSFSANNTRFGGESDCILLENWANFQTGKMSRISILNCSLPGSSTPTNQKVLFKLWDIPEKISIKGSTGLPYTIYGIWINPDLSPSATIKLQSSTIHNSDLPLRFLGNLKAMKYTFQTDSLDNASTDVSIDDCVVNKSILDTDYTFMSFSNGVTVDRTKTDSYGNPVISVTSNAIADTTPSFDYENNFDIDSGWGSPRSKYYYRHLYGGLTAHNMIEGMHTAVFSVKMLTDGDYTFYAHVLRNTRQKRINKGTHIICIPFYYNPSDNYNTIGLTIANMFPEASVQIGRIRIIRGIVNIKTWNSVLKGSTFPARNPIVGGQWFKGDIVENTSLIEQGISPNKYVISKWICNESGAVSNWLQMRSFTGN